jgi:hypothetical protein
MPRAAFAAIAAVGFALAAAPALAQPQTPPAPPQAYVDPAGRFTVTLPGDWPIDVRPTNGFSFVVAGTEMHQCQFVATPRAHNAAAKPNELRLATSQPISAEAWGTVMGAMDGLFRDQGTVISQTVDTSSFWPVQRAQLRAPHGPLQGAIQFRPGLEIWTFCTTPGNIEAGDMFEPIFKSVATAQDAALQAEAERLDVEAAAEYTRIQAQHEAALAEIRRQQAEAEARQAQRNRRRRTN